MSDQPALNSRSGEQMLGKVLRTLTTAAICLLLDLFLIVAVSLLFAGIADRMYNANHLIANPLDRGKDVGAGLVVIYWALFSLLLSVPFCLVMFRKLFLLVSKIWSNK